MDVSYMYPASLETASNQLMHFLGIVLVTSTTFKSRLEKGQSTNLRISVMRLFTFDQGCAIFAKKSNHDAIGIKQDGHDVIERLQHVCDYCAPALETDTCFATKKAVPWLVMIHAIVIPIFPFLEGSFQPRVASLSISWLFLSRRVSPTAILAGHFIDNAMARTLSRMSWKGDFDFARPNAAVIYTGIGFKIKLT